MPKITSLTSNKENVLPATAKTRRGREASEAEAMVEVVGLSTTAKRARSGSSTTTTTKQQAKKTASKGSTGDEQQTSSSSDSARLKSMRVAGEGVVPSEGEQEGGSSGGSNERERLLEDKLALLSRERDEVQGLFDDLRELRQTEPERMLGEWKKMADERDGQAEEYIAKLKGQIKSLESGKDGAMSSSSDGAFIRHSRQEDSRARERRLEEEVARLTAELATSSMALRTKAGPGTMGTSDEKAVRRLYEDLTGLVINKVEMLAGREKNNFRSYHAFLASSGYHNLALKLEESESESISTDGSRHQRQDLVYVPSLDTDRDAEILTSGRLPDYLKASLRFERSTSVRFMNTLHKKLDRQSKRSN